MTPVVSAAEDEVGVIATIESSATDVWSPATSRIDGERLFTPAPLLSVIWIFTGSTWPFFSLFVTGVLVTGGRNAPVPTPTVIVFVSEPPSLSVIFTVPVWLQPAEVYWWFWVKVCVSVPLAPYVWCALGSATPSQLQSADHGLSITPGSLNVPLKVTGAVKTSGPERPVVVPVNAVIVGGTFETATLNVACPEPPSLSVTFTVTVYVVGAPSL